MLNPRREEPRTNYMEKSLASASKRPGPDVMRGSKRASLIIGRNPRTPTGVVDVCRSVCVCVCELLSESPLVSSR